MSDPERLNILLILVDEERKWATLPPGFPFARECPRRARLQAESIDFPNFRASTVPCGPARATLYTGTHFQEHGMSSNKSGELQEDMPTIGNYLSNSGYHCVYKGKWHLHEKFTALLDTLWPKAKDEILKEYGGHIPPRWDALAPWGFKEWNLKGDYWGKAQEGWEHDGIFTDEAVDWLRNHRPTDKPWFLALNLINPHDIMYFLASQKQKQTRDPDCKFPPGRPLLGPPDDPVYKAQWHLQPFCPESEDVDIPQISQGFKNHTGKQFGECTGEDVETYVDYYLNCIRDSDRHIGRLLDTLAELGLDNKTAVIFTSDHGEMCGDYGLRQKGPMLYQGNVSVPFMMRIPGVMPRTCDAALCTVDIAPTICSLAGVQDWRVRFPKLLGQDAVASFSGQEDKRADDDEDLDGATVFQFGQTKNKAKAAGHVARSFMQGLLTKKWKYARVFGPEEQPFPIEWDALEEYNDLILYDIANDPFERKNLAGHKAGAEKHRSLILKLNSRLNEWLAREVRGCKAPWEGMFKPLKDLPPNHHSVSGSHAKGKGKGKPKGKGRDENKKGEGHLYFKASMETAKQVEEIISRMHEGVALSELLPRRRAAEECARPLPVVIYSDFEPDDLMAIAQIWEWKAECLGGEFSRPVVVMCADFASKDGGTVFEKKLLMARLMLGLDPYTEIHILTEGSLESKDGSIHPLAQACYDQYGHALANAASEIAGLADHQCVDFYLIAPGHGHIGALVDKLQEAHSTAWHKLRRVARVSTYTGSFNTRGHRMEDIDGIRQLVNGTPLVDISKFVFFGSDGAHPITQSADTFASPTLAEKISSHSPLLAATFSSFSDEFAGELIAPGKANLFRTKDHAEARSESEIERFNENIAPLFSSEGIGAYACALQHDEVLFAKVTAFKKSTVKAFANGTCDMPLCDQVCFLYDWLLTKHPSLLASSAEGEWWIDPKSGYSGVTQDRSHRQNLRIPAVQPHLAEPKDEIGLSQMRSALEEYLVRHISKLDVPQYVPQAGIQDQPERIEKYPHSFVSGLKSLATAVRLWARQQAERHGEQADISMRAVRTVQHRLSAHGVLASYLCEQICDIALSTAAVTLGKAQDMKLLPEYERDFEAACRPPPHEINDELWWRTQDLFWASARLACAKFRKDNPSIRQEQRVYDRQVRFLAGLRTRGASVALPPPTPHIFANEAALVIPATVVMLSTCREGFSAKSPRTPYSARVEGRCTELLTRAVEELDGRSWVELLWAMRRLSAGAKSSDRQVPVLSCSRRLDLNSQVSMRSPSSRSGRRRALLIGINYTGEQGLEIASGHTDVMRMKAYLTESQGYSNADLRLLLDDGRHAMPDRENIQDGFRWLVSGANAGDSLFLLYSGHGSTYVDGDADDPFFGSSSSGADEALCPVDFRSAGMIFDDEVFQFLIAPLSEGVLLTCVIDCCQSGTILQLPYSFKAERERAVSMDGSGLQAAALEDMVPNMEYDPGKMLQVIQTHPAMCVAASYWAAQLQQMNPKRSDEQLGTVLADVAKTGQMWISNQ